MARTELTITVHKDPIQQGQTVPILVAASSKDQISDLIIWVHAHAGADPWARITAIAGNKDTDAVMTQPAQVPKNWFPLVIDVYESATATEGPDFHRTSEIQYNGAKPDQTFKSVKRHKDADKDKRPNVLRGESTEVP